MNLDYLIEEKFLETPNCIKIDVDGTEEYILKGAKKTLLDKKLKSILVEINNNNDSFLIFDIIKKSGFDLDISNSTELNKIFNRL